MFYIKKFSPKILHTLETVLRPVKMAQFSFPNIVPDFSKYRGSLVKSKLIPGNRFSSVCNPVLS